MKLTPDMAYSVAEIGLFAGFAVTTLAGAAVAVFARRLVRSVSGLALSFMGLAGLYYFLNSPFLSLMQILIYIGAVCVTIMFAIMLADTTEGPTSRVLEFLRTSASLLVAAVFAFGLIVLIGRSTWMPPVDASQVTATGSVQEIGRALLGPFGFAFELISVVLLLAILGALVVARSGRRSQSWK